MNHCVAVKKPVLLALLLCSESLLQQGQIFLGFRQHGITQGQGLRLPRLEFAGCRGGRTFLDVFDLHHECGLMKFNAQANRTETLDAGQRDGMLLWIAWCGGRLTPFTPESLGASSGEADGSLEMLKAAVGCACHLLR